MFLYHQGLYSADGSEGTVIYHKCIGLYIPAAIVETWHLQPFQLNVRAATHKSLLRSITWPSQGPMSGNGCRKPPKANGCFANWSWSTWSPKSKNSSNSSHESQVAHGMYKHLSMTKGGEARSQVVKAAAEWVTRKPPLGKEEPSVSPGGYGGLFGNNKRKDPQKRWRFGVEYCKKNGISKIFKLWLP